MRSTRWIADIGAGRIVAMLVLKNAVEDDEFLAASMGMARKGAAWRITHDRCGAGLLVTDTEQHAPIDTRGGARDPFLPTCLDDNGTLEIVVDTHGQTSAGSLLAAASPAPRLASACCPRLRRSHRPPWNWCLRSAWATASLTTLLRSRRMGSTASEAREGKLKDICVQYQVGIW